MESKVSDEIERKFRQDLETAKALSLETIALEKFKQEKLKQSQAVSERDGNASPIYSQVTIKKSVGTRSLSVESSSPPIQIKPRPRPGAIASTKGLVLPPPIPKRAPSASTDSQDLINLKSPLSKQNPHDTLLQELDLACPSNIMQNLKVRSDVNVNYPPSNRFGMVDIRTQTMVQTVQQSNLRPRQGLSMNMPKIDSNQILRKPPSKVIASQNLIDLGVNANQPSRSSVLSFFDPLLNPYSLERADFDLMNSIPETHSEFQAPKADDITLYNQEYDPFEFCMGLSQREPKSGMLANLNLNQNKRETIYEVLTKEQSPVRTPKSKTAEAANTTQKTSDLPLSISVIQVNAGVADTDLATFAEQIRDLRATYSYNDSTTNLGFVISTKVEAGHCVSNSIKMVVHMADIDQPVNFTCDISSTIDHVISHVLCEVGPSEVNVEDFALKVWGRSEYFTPDSCLHDYEYVHNCIKLERDVHLCLLHVDKIRRNLLRTSQDDAKDLDIKVEDLLSREPVDALTYDAICVLLDTIHSEIDRLVKSTTGKPKGLLQSIKALCSLLGCIETTDLSVALENLTSACSGGGSSDYNVRNSKSAQRPEIVGEDGPYSWVVLPNASSISDSRLRMACADVVSALRKLISAYTCAFRVDFALTPVARSKFYDSASVLDCINLRICALHRLDGSWNFDEYEIHVDLYHGIVSMAQSLFFTGASNGRSAYLCPNRIAFDELVSFHSVAICTLPRESRLVLTLFGRRKLPEGESNGAFELVELGWTAQNFFRYGDDYWTLVQGGRLLPLWPPTSDKRAGYVPHAGRHPRGHVAPLLSVEFPEREEEIRFPLVESSSATQQPRELNSLDDNTQQTLMDIVKCGSFAKMDVYQRELLWEKRHYLTEQPGALAKVLLVAQSWDWASLADLYWLLRHWATLSPLEALQLLLPCFPDVHVRRCAVDWLRPILSDELVDYLPQLVEALKLEPYDHSPLMLFLVERSLSSPQVAHALYWLLNQQLPGISPQNSDFSDAEIGADPRYSGRLQLLLRSLLATCGDSLRIRFMSEQMLVQQLDSCADHVKTTKESLRLSTLLRELEPIHFSLEANPTSLPISPSLQVQGLEVRSCGYFPSNTLPLKLVFQSAEPEVEGEPIINAMYKVGDDLRQDSLTIQMVRIMDKLWLKNGLDLKMVTFGCVPTGPRRGFVELITGAETLRRIQVEHGLTGSFKDRPIADWLAKHNPSPLEYERAVHNFTASCAGYSVATYVFGVCDRHNDNIMVKSTGHLFHIDFGKFLGDAQMFGNFKRDRTPFVLTSDMAYVINGGDKPSQKFHHFVDLCCQAFNIVREHSRHSP